MIDTTDRKRVEEALRDSEERYRTLFNSLIEGFCLIEMIFDDEGKPVDYRFLEINSTFQEQTGLFEAQGKLMRDLAPDHEAHWFEIYGKVALTGELIRFENEAKALNRWFEVCAFRVGGQESRRVAICFNNITERKRAEKALKASETRFRTVAGSLTDVVYEWDLKDKVDWYGDIDGIMGYPANGFPRTLAGWAAKLHPGDTERVMAAIKGHLERSEPYIIEYRVMNREGKWRWWSARGTALRDEQNLPYWWIGSITDITGRAQAEEEIRKLNAGLEDRVVKRTTQLEASNKELEAFSYSVSHDLRAPLRHVSGYVELLNKHFRSDLPEKGRHYLNSITESVHLMGKLIDDLLEFSRTGRTEMHHSELNMNDIVKEVIESLKIDEPKRKIKWVIGNLAPVVGDEAMFRLVWLNLLNNAVKFTRTRKKARIEIGFLEEERESVFFVRDNGVGFDMQYSQKLFGVFQRLHRVEDFEGTGIGLANVHRIVSRHGGNTWAEADPGKGAVFYFSIPEIKEEI